MDVASELTKSGIKDDSGPVWKGPEVDGVTQGLLARFLQCRERFRIYVIDGLRQRDTFNPRLEFGNMWHVMEEDYSREPSVEGFEKALLDYCRKLSNRYPSQQDQIEHWYGMAKAMFPEYVCHYADNPDVKSKVPLMQEQSFDVKYKLTSGRVVRLRGKWDAVDLIKDWGDLDNAPKPGIYIQENKTKSTIDQAKVERQLRFDLQTMFYLVALKTQYYTNEPSARNNWSMKNGVCLLDHPICGVRYNVIRRPAHKTVSSAMTKLRSDMLACRADEWFARWPVEVSAEDIERFKQQTLNPVLEQLCQWWDVVKHGNEAWHFRSGIHFRTPYMGYNPLGEGGFGEVDDYMETGNSVGLEHVKTVFPELEEPSEQGSASQPNK